MNNEPAFPVFPETGGGHAAAFQGMTLRDYFAAHVAVGMMSEYWNGNHLQDPTFVDIAQQAYALADAMLKAREQ